MNDQVIHNFPWVCVHAPTMMRAVEKQRAKIMILSIRSSLFKPFCVFSPAAVFYLTHEATNNAVVYMVTRLYINS